MKLGNINRLNEILGSSRRAPIAEGVLSNLLTGLITTMQVRWGDDKKTVRQHGLTGYISSARALEVSLLDETPEALKWWKSVFDALDKKNGWRTSKKRRTELVAKLKAEIGPRINRDLETAKERTRDLYGGDDVKDARLDKMFAKIFEPEAPTKPKDMSNAEWEALVDAL